MALSYDQSAALMNNLNFRGRVKVCCLKYADFILNEASTNVAHNTRYRWAQNTTANPDGTAMNIAPPTVMDAAVQAGDIDADGDSTIDDAALQSAVEGVVNKSL